MTREDIKTLQERYGPSAAWDDSLVIDLCDFALRCMDALDDPRAQHATEKTNAIVNEIYVREEPHGTETTE